MAGGEALQPESIQQSNVQQQRLSLVIGKSMLINSEQPVDRISVTAPSMVDALVISPQQVLLNGKAPGVTTFILWDKADGYLIYDIEVQRDVTLLIEKLHEINKNIRVEVQAANDSVILWGKVPSAAIITKAVTVAAAFFGGGNLIIKSGPGGTILPADSLPMKATSSTAFSEAGKNVIRSWNVGEGAIVTTDNGKVISFLEVEDPQQVELQVRIAEINRTALKELGVNLHDLKLSGFSFFTLPMGFPPVLSKGATAVIDSHNAVLLALEEQGLATILAEPNLTAISGQQASFLAGGEFPYVEASDTAVSRTFNVTFREFGVRLDFTPEVKENGMINLKVSPEVSAIDRENAVILPIAGGIEFPPINVRRAETTVEIMEGDSLVIGGLISQEMTRELSQVPWIGDVPYIGSLFRKTRFVNRETELIIMITPRLVKPMSPEQKPEFSKVLTELPSDYELFLMGHLEGSEEMAGPFGHEF